MSNETIMWLVGIISLIIGFLSGMCGLLIYQGFSEKKEGERK